MWAGSFDSLSLEWSVRAWAPASLERFFLGRFVLGKLSGVVGVVHLWTATVWDNDRERAPKGSSYLFGPVALPSHGRGRAVLLRDGKGRKHMIDLGSPDVWPSTREKAASWEKQSYVRDGFLTLWDAANLMDPEGYGGIFETCSGATRGEIAGLYLTLQQSLQKDPPSFFGYAPAESSPVKVKTAFGVEKLDLFPGVAFLEWYEQHKQEGIDGRFFERYRQPCQGVPSNVSLRKNPFWGEEEPDRNNPYCWRLARRNSLKVKEFADFYCGCVSSSSARELMEETEDHIKDRDGSPYSYWEEIGYLCGYESIGEEIYNPRDFEFPVEAYVVFLNEIGLDVPREWAHIKPQTIEKPSPIHDEKPAAVEAVAAQDVAGVNACKEDGRTASDDVEILDGLTLADFKRYLDSNPPLKYVLPIVIRTLLMAEGDPKKTDKSLTARLRESARKDGWGTCSGNVLSDAQGVAIDKMFLPAGKAGAGNKKGLRVLPAKEFEKE